MLNVPVHWRTLGPLDRHPLLAGDHHRPIRILIDERATRLTKAHELLLTFGEIDGVDVFSTETSRSSCVEIKGPDAHPDSIRIDWTAGGVVDRRAVLAASSWAESAARTATAVGVTNDEARRVLVLAQAGIRFGVDALVSDSPVLLAPMWNSLARRAHCTTAGEAAALVGLYLRAAGRTTVRVNGGSSTFLPGDRIYRAAALAVLPAHPRWMHAAFSRWRTGGTEEAFGLVRAIDARLARALLARDYFNVRLRHPQPAEVWPETLFFFESFLFSLIGALDAAARLLTVSYLPGVNRHQAGFGRGRWVDRLRSAAPELSSVLSDEGPVLSAFTLLARLRNFVHEGVLTDELNSTSNGAPLTVRYGKGTLALGPEAATGLTVAADHLGGSKRWGLDPQLDGALLVYPSLFVPAAIDAVPVALRAMMSAADPARLSTALVEPFDQAYFTPDLAFATEVLLLTGLRDPADLSSASPV